MALIKIVDPSGNREMMERIADDYLIYSGWLEKDE